MMAAFSTEETLTFSPDGWEDDRFVDSTCICGVPSTENMVQCNGEDCPIFLYHRDCVAIGSEDFPDSATAVWSCDFCRPSSTDTADTGITTSTSGPVPTSSTSKTPSTKSSDENSTGTSGSKQKESEVSRSNPRTKRKIFKWNPQLKKESLLQKAKDLVSNLFQQITKNEFYEGTDIAACAAKVDCNAASFVTFAETAVSMVWDCAASGKGNCVGPQMNTAIFQSFHKLRCGKDIMAAWEAFLELQTISTTKLVRMGLLQYILRCVLEEIMRQLQEEKTSVEENYPSMAKEEEGVLRYVAGFVPFALLKKYSRMKSPLGKRFRDILITWKIESDNETEADSFLAYTSAWITYQNRGGLYKVCDKVYKFFRSMEIVVRRQLSMHKLVGNAASAKEILESAIRSNIFTEKCWEVLICDHLSRDESENLFTTIINYYIKIRMNGFVKVYVNLKKRENASKGMKGRKALRKELKIQSDKLTMNIM